MERKADISLLACESDFLNRAKLLDINARYFATLSFLFCSYLTRLSLILPPPPPPPPPPSAPFLPTSLHVLHHEHRVAGLCLVHAHAAEAKQQLTLGLTRLERGEGQESKSGRERGGRGRREAHGRIEGGREGRMMGEQVARTKTHCDAHALQPAGRCGALRRDPRLRARHSPHARGRRRASARQRGRRRAARPGSWGRGRQRGTPKRGMMQ